MMSILTLNSLIIGCIMFHALFFTILNTNLMMSCNVLKHTIIFVNIDIWNTSFPDLTSMKANVQSKSSLLRRSDRFNQWYQGMHQGNHSDRLSSAGCLWNQLVSKVCWFFFYLISNVLKCHHLICISIPFWKLDLVWFIKLE